MKIGLGIQKYVRDSVALSDLASDGAASAAVTTYRAFGDVSASGDES